MIDLVMSHGNVFVWSAEDWLTLRREHRIVGATIGCPHTLPRQEIMQGLPLMILPEEVTLLLENKIARLVEYPSLRQEPDDDMRKVFENFRKKMFKEQETALKDGKKKLILGKIDSIIEGKKRKSLGLKTSKKSMKKTLDDATAEAVKRVEIDRDALVAEQLSKCPNLDPDDALVQIHTSDPVMFHSQFIVSCMDIDEEIPILNLTGQCRVACHVRKTQVYAYFSDDNKIAYQSFQYDNSNMV
ncbi:Similar to TSEN34: tRNA-splicing endonuclease subunit Sen34 (Homo sapiens) [Cotesia congregata]|uniref:tRNA-intron lyase n=1 Tax=Cotesia congregata TaxID=51543 RepID=A0A8J2MZ63_COTCN|nr:Similar to TSEN34: tRNA-splicing endonuclease subunit Sen34 (Homo sapiens) [Cotesia congregata]